MGLGDLMEAAVITTYRCNFKCYMCNVWKYPTDEKKEIKPEILKKLPNLSFCNITGGEPFLREDIEEIISVIKNRAKRVVISSNGYFTERILDVFRKNKDIGIRISIEGLPASNDEARGIKNGFDHGLRTLTTLHAMGIKDIGFGITVSDKNAKDMIELYRLADAMNLEFATAITHNSFYFHKHDNTFNQPNLIAAEFEKIVFELLKTNKPKNWFRAYFNLGLANKVRGGVRLLPCEVGTDMFFIDPYGNLMPCNGSDEAMIMGNLNEQKFYEIWNSDKADEIRKQVKECVKDCWMIGSVSPAMKKRVWVPTKWIIRNKLKIFKQKGKAIYIDPINK